MFFDCLKAFNRGPAYCLTLLKVVQQPTAGEPEHLTRSISCIASVSGPVKHKRTEWDRQSGSELITRR